jgi:NB-ARC domain
MRRPFGGIRLSMVNTTLLVSGVALLLVAFLGRWVTIGGNQILRGAPWWVQFVLGGVGLLAIAWAVASSWEPARELWTVGGFLGAPPKMPPLDRLVERPKLLEEEVVAALRAGGGPVALTGMGGAGKSTLAAGACGDRRVRRRFRDGVTWLETDPGQDPVTLLGDLARRLGLPESESGFATVVQGRDKIAALLRGKRMLVAVDNVWERGPLDALVGLGAGCMVMFTTRLPELATTFGATPIAVDELTPDQALALLGRWTGQAPVELPPGARALCTRVGNLALGVAMAGAMVARGRSFTDVVALIEQDLTPGTCRSGTGIPVPKPAGGHRGGHLRSPQGRPAKVRAAGGVRRAWSLSPRCRRGLVAAGACRGRGG